MGPSSLYAEGDAETLPIILRKGHDPMPFTFAIRKEVAMTKQLLRVGEAAEVLAVSSWTIYR